MIRHPIRIAKGCKEQEHSEKAEAVCGGKQSTLAKIATKPHPEPVVLIVWPKQKKGTRGKKCGAPCGIDPVARLMPRGKIARGNGISAVS